MINIIGVSLGGVVSAIFLGYFLIKFISEKGIQKGLKRIGQSAEEAINKDIRLWARKENFKFIPASLYKYGKNKVFEVDSVLITTRSIIVIEIKSISGDITGDANSPSWFKNLGDKKFNISNPVIQNDKHINHINNLLEKRIPIISLIIFSNRSNTLDIKNKPEHVLLIKQVELINTLDKIINVLPVKYDLNTCQNIFKKIKSHKTNKSIDINLHKKITKQI